MNFLDALQWVYLAGAILAFCIFMRQPSNPLRWWHYIATKGTDGNYYADLDKLGKATGIIIGSWALLRVAGSATIDFLGFAAVLGAYFAFVGSIAGFSAYLRYKNNILKETVNGTIQGTVVPPKV